MPTPALQSLAKKAGVSTKKAEEKWEEAKRYCREQGKTKTSPDFYRCVMGMTKKYLGVKESAHSVVTQLASNRRQHLTQGPTPPYPPRSYQEAIQESPVNIMALPPMAIKLGEYAAKTIGPVIAAKVIAKYRKYRQRKRIENYAALGIPPEEIPTINIVVMVHPSPEIDGRGKVIFRHNNRDVFTFQASPEEIEEILSPFKVPSMLINKLRSALEREESTMVEISPGGVVEYFVLSWMRSKGYI